MSEYNGWRNYETWKINLELFDGMAFDDRVCGETCKEIAEELVESQSQGWARDLALSFLAQVYWPEIADAVNEGNDFGAEDDEDGQPSELTEWLDFDPDC